MKHGSGPKRQTGKPSSKHDETLASPGPQRGDSGGSASGATGRASEHDETFIVPSGASPDASSPLGARPHPGSGAPSHAGTVIGRYRIIEKIGEGGMGVVFEAEQEKPRRRVALKLIRGGQLADDL